MHLTNTMQILASFGSNQSICVNIHSRGMDCVKSQRTPIETRLTPDHTQTRLSLELNEEHVSRAVQVFIDFSVAKLRLIEDDGELQKAVRNHIYATY